MEGDPREEESYLDNETGEIRHTVKCLRSERREEGEDTEPKVQRIKKKKFQIPMSYIKDPGTRKTGERFTDLPEKASYRHIEERAIHGTQNVSLIIFVLPTFLIFPAWTSIFCVICEACIHMLSHKRILRVLPVKQVEEENQTDPGQVVNEKPGTFKNHCLGIRKLSNYSVLCSRLPSVADNQLSYDKIQ